MYKQGKSLGKQLQCWMPALDELLNKAHQDGQRVWFMGRDCDVFAEAFKNHPACRYLVGLNRENARKLQHRRKISSWLRSIGVREGDIFVDSGFNGSIYERMQRGGMESFDFVLLTASENAYGRPLVPELNDEKHRHLILALEHSPKREVCDWDEERRVPRVQKAENNRAAQSFFKGCVAALKGKE